MAILGLSRLAEHVAAGDLATAAAAGLIGILWLRSRLGQRVGASMFERWVWIPLAALVVTAIWGLVAAMASGYRLPPAPAWSGPLPFGLTSLPQPVTMGLAAVVGLALALPAMASGDSIARRAAELPQPRLPGLMRTARLAAIFGLLVTAGAAFAIVALVPPEALAIWDEVPLIGLLQFVPGAVGLRVLLTMVVALAGVAMLGHAADASLDDATMTLQRLSRVGAVPESLRALHPRFGTRSRLTDVVCLTSILFLLASGGHVAWLARAYAVGLVWTYVAKLIMLRRMRDARADARARHGAGARAGPVGVGAASRRGRSCGRPGRCAAGARRSRDVGRHERSSRGCRRRWRSSIVGPSNRTSRPTARPSSCCRRSSRSVMPKRGPGGLLVPVRHLYSLSHVSQALTAAGDRDVVVMTVRVLGVDVEDDATIDPRPTPAEQLLLSQVVALAERQNRAVRLLIVPARDVFDAIATAMHRLRSSEVHVGESTTLPADGQARLLGEAWERLELEQALDVRLVIHHPSGRADVFYLGVHAPALSSRDLNLIHRLWLDAAKAVGPHVHHHDVVRAALTQMEQQLSGPEREQALEAIRRVARPADELAAVVRRRDFSQLRDMIRNRPPNDLAEVLTHMSVEDQVVDVPAAAPQGRRRHVRVPLARRAGAPAQGHGPGRRRGAA